MWKKALFAAGPMIFGLGLFVFIFWKFVPLQETLENLRMFGWVGLGVHLALASLVLAAPAVSWTILMRGEGMKIPLWTALKANFMGFPLNFIAPTMYLGSEPLKMLYVAKQHGEPNRRVLATIIVGKFQEIGALLVVMLIATAISVVRINFSRAQSISIIVSMLLLAVIFGVALWGFLGNHQPTVKVIEFLARFKRRSRRLARMRTWAREMEVLIHHAFTRRWKLFLVAQAVTMVSALSIMLRPWVYFYFTRGDYAPSEHLCAIFVLTNVINSLPHLPGGLGVFEGGMVTLFGLLGYGRDHAAAFSTVTRAGDIVLILIGSWLIVHFGLSRLARRVAEGREKVSIEDAAPNGDATSV